MPVVELQNFRQKFPEYDDMPDAVLADKLATKHPEYSDLPEKVRASGGGIQVNRLPESNFQPNNVALETAKNTVGYIGGRAKGLLEVGANAILHPIQTGKSLLSAASHPIQTGKAIVKSAVEDPTGFATDTALTMGAGAIGGRILKGLPKTVQNVGEGLRKSKEDKIIRKEETASRMNNSLIGAQKKDVVYGDPGRGIAKEGITFKKFDEGQAKIQAKLDELGSQLDSVYDMNDTVINDYSEALRPLAKARKELMQKPAHNERAIKKLDKIIQDVTGSSTGQVRKFHLSPKEARQLKQYIDGFADWESVGKADSIINHAVKDSYHAIDNILDTSLPQSKLLNQRVTDLISANKVIKSKTNKIKVSDPVPGGIHEIYNAPFNFLRSPRIKTNIASRLVRKYPNETTQVFQKPLFRPKEQSNLLTSQTRMLPAPKDVPYNPTGVRNVGGKSIVTPSQYTVNDVINLPDKNIKNIINRMSEDQRNSIASELKKQLAEFKKSGYVKNIKDKLKNKKINKIINSIEGKDNPYVNYLKDKK